MTENPLDQAGEARLYRALRRFWHPVLWADELAGRPVAARLLDEPIVLVRLAGEVRAFRDLCVHRGTALSLGWVDDGCLVCPYHGWTYDPSGVCTRIPASHGTNIPTKARIQRYAAVEHAGLIWVCLEAGPDPDDPVAGFPLPDFPESCPLSAKETRNFTWNARNYDLDPERDQAFVDFQQLILEQDRVVVESQRPEELPIDLSEELHIKGVDRFSIDYRRWLGEIAASEPDPSRP